MPKTIHLIANAHLDPVWLWDWREGLNEGILTVRTILSLMDENPDLTFIRGEAAVYQHIERHDPETFARIRAYVEAGRWDIVGGTHIQPDTNLPATEIFCRHFERAQHYFQERFGRTAKIAWAADSFGHSAGLPEILASMGMEGYCFSRPFADVRPLDNPAFWWEGQGGSRVLAYRIPVGWYGSERSELPTKLDNCLKRADQDGMETVACFYGVGNHGGGPTRRHLAAIREWTDAHPEVTVVHSGLHRFFAALKEENERKGGNLFPTYRGELNFCLRGCYASVAKFKYLYRRAEAAISSVERTATAIENLARNDVPLNHLPEKGWPSSAGGLGSAWDTLLFNSFHDILPGSSIERAYDDQLAWLGGAIHQAQRTELEALNALALQVDTRVPEVENDHPSAVPLLIWNPHLHPYRRHIEIEAGLDYRPIWPYQGKPNELPVEIRGGDGSPLPFQRVDTENHFGTDIFPWRVRAVVPVELPALGWNVVTMGWVEGAEKPDGIGVPASAPAEGQITNGIYSVQAEAGKSALQITRNGQPIFAGEGMSLITVEDTWGSWGGMGEEKESLDLSTVRHTWAVQQMKTLESGPERAALWVRLSGGNSWLDLTFHLYRGREAVDVKARVLWNDRSARLKLVFPVGEEAEFEVPGGTVKRGPMGEVPGGRWARVTGSHGDFGFASNALYSFDCKDGAFRAAIVRAGRYGSDAILPEEADLWRPAVDCGELRFQFLLSSGEAELPILAQELEEPPTALMVAPSEGVLPRTGSLASLSPSSLKVLALKPTEDGSGILLRVQETAGITTKPELVWQGQSVPLPEVGPYRIVTWRLT